jgi:hypothetical protein
MIVRVVDIGENDDPYCVNLFIIITAVLKVKTNIISSFTTSSI